MRVIRDAPVPLPRPIPTPEPAGVRAGVWEGGAGGAASRSVSPPTKKQRKKLPGAAAALGAAPGWAPGPPHLSPARRRGRSEQSRAGRRRRPGCRGATGGGQGASGVEQGARGKRPQAQPGPALPTTHLESLERLAGRQARAAAGQEFGRKREGFYFPWSLKRGSEECEE